MSRAGDVKQLLKLIDATPGWSWKRTAKGHYMIFKDGRAVTTMSGTGGRGRGDMNAMATLRQAKLWRDR